MSYSYKRRRKAIKAAKQKLPAGEIHLKSEQMPRGPQLKFIGTLEDLVLGRLK